MKHYVLGFAFSLLAVCTGAQQVTKEDYARAVSFLWGNLNNKKVFNANIMPIWAGDSSGVAFVTQDAGGSRYQCVLWTERKIRPFFDHEKLAALLKDSFNIWANANNLLLSELRFTDKNNIRFGAGGSNFSFNRQTNDLKKTGAEIARPMESKSPDGQWVAFTKDYNLYLKSATTGEIKPLSKAGTKNFEYASYYGWGDIIVGENGDRPSQFRVNWSPDNKWIQTFVCDLRYGNKMYLLDWGVDSLYRARLLSYYRASPGDTGMVRMIPVFFNVETGEEWRRDELRSTHTNPIDYEWSKTEPGIIYQENMMRGYQQADLHRVNLNKRQSDLLHSEISSTNLDGYASWLVEEAGKFIIASESSGWRQLYALDIQTKQLTPITTGKFFVNNIVSIQPKIKTVYLLASGRQPGQNPYYQQLYKADMDGKSVALLTPENANHDIAMSPDGQFLTDNYSGPDQPTTTVLREAVSGKIISEISRANDSILRNLGYKYPETFTATARDGVTVIYGSICKPTHFDPSKKYPVIDNSYTGPHTNMFPRSFLSSLSRSNQALAELGFVVITVDGMGTAGRSKAFHNVSYKNMGKNLLDHKLAIEQLAQKYPWVDADRVGIFGHSAGGFDAGHAVLEYPDFYKVAVASSADHDFRMEKDWWPEMYMGWPVDSSYEAVSNITMAGHLKGKLLITHGGIDENVNPSATFKLAEALIKADKEFDMLILPSQRHGYTGIYNDYFTKKRWNFFVEHLLGLKPIWDFPMR